MNILGLTGGIGSGKSTVSSILSHQGIAIIDADKVALSVLQPNESAYKEVINYFGNDILDTDDYIDRKILASIVFQDKKKLQLLNKITHKYIIFEIKKTIKDLKGDPSNLFAVIDAPIAHKEGFIDLSDEIWVVCASFDIRLERIMRRNNLSRKEAIPRLNSQNTEEEYLKLADRVIYNNSDLESLKRQVLKALEDFRNKVSDSFEKHY